MTEYEYHILDVFTDRPYAGNQLAVLPDARGLSGEQMQTITREFNLSETAFVLPPEKGGDHRVRIFTPGFEMPMAGHPSVGTAYVLARLGMIAQVDSGQTVTCFEEGVGPIDMTIEWQGGQPQRIYMDQPIPVHGAQFSDRAGIARMLSLDVAQIDDSLPIEIVSSGVPFLYVPVKGIEAIRTLRFRADVWEQVLKEMDTPPIFVFTTETESEKSAAHCRMFAPQMGLIEDPATGAASGPLGSYLLRHGLVADASAGIISEQGYEMGRPSQILIRIVGTGDQLTRVQIGGQCASIGSGRIQI